MQKFQTYCEARRDVDLSLAVDDLCVEAVLAGLSAEEFSDKVLLPAMTEGHYDSPETLVLEFTGWLNRLFGRKDRTSEDEYGPGKVPLQDVPYADPYKFRRRQNREMSRSDMLAANAEAGEENQRRDAHNRGVEINAILGQHGQRMAKARQEIFDSAAKVKDWMAQVLDNQVSKQAGLPVAAHKKDVLDQFVAFMKRAMADWTPNVDLGKFIGDADISGVKSGLQPQHLGANRDRPHYGTDASGGKKGKGWYIRNQDYGDIERGVESERAADFRNKARRVVQ